MLEIHRVETLHLFSITTELALLSVHVRFPSKQRNNLLPIDYFCKFFAFIESINQKTNTERENPKKSVNHAPKC